MKNFFLFFKAKGAGGGEERNKNEMRFEMFRKMGENTYWLSKKEQHEQQKKVIKYPCNE